MVYDFGNRLRKLRENRHLTQTQVAVRLNISKSAMSGYENNIKTPSVDILIQLAQVYNVTTDYLLGLDNRDMLYIDGLTSRQKEILTVLLTEFRTDRSVYKRGR